MYKTILVPLDGSKRAEAILPHVEELARRFGAKVIFLQIVEDVMMLGYDAVLDISAHQQDHDQRKKEAKSYLAGLEGVFKEKKISAKNIVSFGSVVQSILDTAAREGADLIAMASHGRGSLSRVFYGSVAAGVLHSIDRPLLIIRSRGS
jgi:nucleotide-binding universal stress UspA family protein